MNYSFSFIDLFSGIGGFRKALSNNGGACIGFSEVNKDAIDYYCRNYDEDISLNLGDITKIENISNCDILTAGVPCQSWSIAGKGLGFNDDRGLLWNDTIELLGESGAKAFIFENVKGLNDPRNRKSLEYIINKIESKGYSVQKYLLNSYNYGVPQNRERLYLIGFKDDVFFNKFKLTEGLDNKGIDLGSKIGLDIDNDIGKDIVDDFSCCFSFNDLRGGNYTIHTWDILDVTNKQKKICNFLLKNRRKKKYGLLDGNCLSLEHFKEHDSSIDIEDIEGLINLDILRREGYRYVLTKGLSFVNYESDDLNNNDEIIILYGIDNGGEIKIDELKVNKKIKNKGINISKSIKKLIDFGFLEEVESRFDFKNKKISSGIKGINRIYMSNSKVFSTLVSSDSNDYIALRGIKGNSINEIKQDFLDNVYFKELYRKINKREACLIQGFSDDFILPDSRSRWMKLIGNSVSVPVIDSICKDILKTGIFT